MNLCLSLNEHKPLLADIALDIHNLIVHRNFLNCIKQLVLVKDNEINEVFILYHNKGAISLNFLNTRAHFNDTNLIFFTLVKN